MLDGSASGAAWRFLGLLLGEPPVDLLARLKIEADDEPCPAVRCLATRWQCGPGRRTVPAAPGDAGRIAEAVGSRCQFELVVTAQQRDRWPHDCHCGQGPPENIGHLAQHGLLGSMAYLTG